MVDQALYEGREQTFVKHYFLEQYLDRFAHIIGWSWKRITYVDGFSGPWESRDPNLRDTSFSIAVEAFTKARADLAIHGRAPAVRCLFIEKDPNSFKKLKACVDSVSDVQAFALPEELETAVPKVVDFVHEAGPDAFSFIFIDPKGWTGFALDAITPLLRLRPGEVLINFMTHHIRRFVDLEENAESFILTFGKDVRDVLRNLPRQEREEKLVGEYMRQIRDRGGFSYVGSVIVQKPEIETTFFHLIYATRDDAGIVEFKKIEKKAMSAAAEIRADAKERRRSKTSGQLPLLAPSQIHRSSQAELLRRRYLEMAHRRVLEALVQHGSVEYRRLWRRAVALPLVWESDLHEWIKEWRANGQASTPGLSNRQVPSLDRNDIVVWRS